MGFGTKLRQAVVSWFSLLIARSGLNDMLWSWLKTWKLERSNRVRKRKLQATHRERRRVPRKMGDGDCRNSVSGTVGVERIGYDRVFFHILEHFDLQEKFPSFDNMCITAVLLYQYRHCRPSPWEKRKIRDYDRSTRTLTHTLTGMPWGGQCLNAVSCEGSSLIRSIWLLSLERL